MQHSSSQQCQWQQSLRVLLTIASVVAWLQRSRCLCASQLGKPRAGPLANELNRPNMHANAVQRYSLGVKHRCSQCLLVC
jgi:hypothetical protein